MLHDLGIECFQVIICPRKDIFKILKQFYEGFFSIGLQSIPRFIVWGFGSVPKLMVSYLIRELLVLQLGTDLNLSYKSKNFSNLSTELGTGFTCSKTFSTEQNSIITEKSHRFRHE